MSLIHLVASHDEEALGLWEEAWSIFTDPSHIMAELGWTIIQDVLVIWLAYGLLFKKVILYLIRYVFLKYYNIKKSQYRYL
jgi:hypothetical protein